MFTHAQGREIVFKVGLALLEHSQDTLMQLDMEEMLKVRTCYF